MPAPSDGATESSNACVIPGIPAVPKKSAYSDHRNAAEVPMEISVSIVAVPCLRLVQAALWNGQAAQTMTGAARARGPLPVGELQGRDHCQRDHRDGEHDRADQPVLERGQLGV